MVLAVDIAAAVALFLVLSAIAGAVATLPGAPDVLLYIVVATVVIRRHVKRSKVTRSH